MTESDIQKLLAEASQVLDNQQYAAAEDLQRRAIQLLETQSEASRVADELEKLAGIHFQQGKWNNFKRDRRQMRIAILRTSAGVFKKISKTTPTQYRNGDK
ncbi:MAG TPA: hypothetical protein VG759_09815 [Candidatus Angelobacter sp.]|jgi:hypothetical protein|nr:hypothetical protein [Candidatus Angelobacter sp.]